MNIYHHRVTKRNFLSALLLAAALFSSGGSTRADTAVAVDLRHRFGQDPWGIATGGRNRLALQKQAANRCLRAGGHGSHIVVGYARGNALAGPSALVIGQGRRGKSARAASGSTYEEAVAQAIEQVKADGATAWYTAKVFDAMP